MTRTDLLTSSISIEEVSAYTCVPDRQRVQRLEDRISCCVIREAVTGQTATAVSSRLVTKISDQRCAEIESLKKEQRVHNQREATNLLGPPA